MQTKNTLALALLGLVTQLSAQTIRIDDETMTRLRATKQAKITAAVTALGEGVTPRRVVFDRTGRAHVRLRQHHQGVRIYGEDLVAHLGQNDQLATTTGERIQGVNIGVTPTLTREQLEQKLGPDAKAAELIIVRAPNTRDGWKLNYLIKTTDPAAPEYLRIDAHTGDVVERWPAWQEELQAAVGTGNTFYFGQQQLNTARDTDTNLYRLRDMTRGESEVYNMQDTAPSEGIAAVSFEDSNNIFGDSGDWKFGMATHSTRGQTAGADVLFSIRHIWDMFLLEWGRLGLDDDAGALKARVHYRKEAGKRYGDARWDGTYANFGDGSESDSNSRTDMPTVGHEFGHALWSYALDYEGGNGEQGGLNEGHGDIMGALLTYWYEGGGHFPGKETQWKGTGRALNPSTYSIDGETGLSYYVPDMGDREVHVQGCAYGHAFVLLVFGAVTDETHHRYSTFLPNGMPGIGVQKAADIWYLATTAYLVGSPTFAKMRQAYIDAADHLFGATSDEAKAVRNAWGAIGVGAVAADSANPVPSLAVPIINEAEQSLFVWGAATDDIGVAQLEFRLDGNLFQTVNGNFIGTLSHQQYVDLAGLPLGNHTLQVKAIDFKGKQATTQRQFTIQGVNQLILNPGFENGSTSWTSAGAAVFGNDADFAFLGNRWARLDGLGYVSQKVTIPANANAAGLSYRVKVVQGLPPQAAGDYMQVMILSNTGQLLQSVQTITALTNTYSAVSNNYKHFSHGLGAYIGQTIEVRFHAIQAFPARFSIDNVSVTYTAAVEATLVANADPGEGSVTFATTNVEHISTNAIKQVTYKVNGQVAGASGTNPFIFVRPASDFTTNVNYSATGVVYDHGDDIVAQIGPTPFKLEPVNQLIQNGGFEIINGQWGMTGETAQLGNVAEAMYYKSFLGNRFARLGGKGSSHTSTLYQLVNIPANAQTVKLSFRVRAETDDYTPSDYLQARVLNQAGVLLGNLGSVPATENTQHASNWKGYTKRVYDLTPYKGQIVKIEFRCVENSSLQTTFFIDNVSVTYTVLGYAGN